MNKILLLMLALTACRRMDSFEKKIVSRLEAVEKISPTIVKWEIGTKTDTQEIGIAEGQYTDKCYVVMGDAITKYLELKKKGETPQILLDALVRVAAEANYHDNSGYAGEMMLQIKVLYPEELDNSIDKLDKEKAELLRRSIFYSSEEQRRGNG